MPESLPSQPEMGISYDSLSSEVRPYADNLRAQIYGLLERYGAKNPEELKAANPTDKDLEHLADLLEQLDHIRKTGAAMEKTKRELFHLDLESSLQEAREILGDENVYGPDKIQQVFEVDLAPSEIPNLPFSREDLEKAKELGMILVLRVSHDSDYNPLTPARMHELLQPRLDAEGRGKMLFRIDWYKDEPFFTRETPVRSFDRARNDGGGRAGDDTLQAEWKLITRDILPDSTSKNYLEQTRLLRDKLKDLGWLTGEEAAEVTDKKLAEIEPFLTSDWKKASQLLANLNITTNHRRSLSEALYDTMLVYLSQEDTGDRPLPNRYDWVMTLSSDGILVSLGIFDSEGASVDRWRPGARNSAIGVVFSR